MATINLEQVTQAVGLVSTVLPQAMAAYVVLRTVWLSKNPGKTEADFLATLDAASQQNVDDAARILIADGFSLDASGNWVAPAAA